MQFQSLCRTGSIQQNKPLSKYFQEKASVNIIHIPKVSALKLPHEVIGDHAHVPIHATFHRHRVCTHILVLSLSQYCSCDMQPIVRSRLQPSLSALKCGRFRSAYATSCLRRPSQPRIGRCSTQSPLLSTSTSTPLLAKHMGGGPVFPSQQFSTMHRAPAAMVTKPMTDPNVEIRTPRDPNTLSNYHNYVTRHTSVDFEIDFEKKRMVGTVVLKMESLVDGDAKVDVVLDSKCV
jgi:hypothetical protein